MSSLADLEKSMQEYETQLAQVDQAIENATDETEQLSLEDLKRHLQEALLLTLQQLEKLTEQEIVPQNARPTNGFAENDPFADEMALFMSEIRETEAMSKSPAVCIKDDSLVQERCKQIKEELSDIVGQKCSAPHTHAWGATTYHNALVCGADSVEFLGEDDLDTVQVKVLFTNPTHQNMIPCPFYLDGECRFDTENCRFSHGEDILYSDLKKYKEPDFSLLNRNRCPVLVKKSDNIWYKARVSSANFDEKTCSAKLEHSKEEVQCDFTDVLPIIEESSNDSSSDLEGGSSDDNNDYEAMHRASLVEKSLLTPAPDQALGEWEKYTKGFGSKILQKLGYVLGTGLGHNGEGIITPISAQILPPGRSLDHCMALREQANGDKDLFSVERKMKRMKKKQDASNRKAYERGKHKADVFSFINDSLFSSPSTSKSQNKVDQAPTVQKNDLKSYTNVNLNVEKFKIGEGIRKKEREIQIVNESLQRHKDGTVLFKQLSSQLQAKTSELDQMKTSEYKMGKEQDYRRDKTKLTIF